MNTAPIISIRSNQSPYSVLSALSYVQSTLGGNYLPVLQGEVSNTLIFRIYNNFAKAVGIASAVNVRVTTFDGPGIGSHSATQSLVVQEWVRVYESGYGENSIAPGQYTQYQDVATAVGGAANEYVPAYGSDGSTTPRIRAGTDTNGVGFIEISSYAEMPDTVGMALNNFAVSVIYDWTS